MLADPLDQLDLLLWCQAYYNSFNHTSQADFVNSNEAVEVHVGEEAHDELTVHAVCDATVAGDRVTEVLDLEGAFQARGEEATKGRDERGKSGEDEDVHLHGCHGEVLDVREPDGKVVDVRNEDGVGGALESSPDVCSEVLVRLAIMQRM
jgi:hypothetical protein